MNMFAIVRIRGSVNLTPDSRKTLELLKLSRPNHCVIFQKNKTIIGMLRSVDNIVTWGEISEQMLEKLIYKRGRTAGDKRVEKKYAKAIAEKIAEKKEAGIKDVFRLSPPSGGYKSVKEFFPKGAMGYRRDKMDQLLKRMI
jgi:large subunit ribosomal protein L30